MAAGEAVARLVAFAGFVYLARTLGAEAYGVIGFATAIILYLSRIADGGMEFFGMGIRDIAEDPRRIGTVAPSLLAVRVFVGGTCVVALSMLALILPRPEGVVVALYGLTLLAVGAGTRWIYLGLQDTRPVAFTRTAGELLVLILLVVAVRGPDDLLHAPLAQFTGEAVAAAMLLWGLSRRGWRMRFRLDWSIAWPIFRRASPLVGSALLGLLIYNSDLIMLRFFRDAAAVGVYAVAYTLISFTLNLGTTYGQSLLPALTRVIAGQERQALYQNALAQVLALTVPIAVGGYLLASEVVNMVFGSEYGAAVAALQILLWSIPLGLMREVATMALVASGARSRILRVTAAAAGLNVVLNLVLIPSFGILGAAVATVLTEAVRTIATAGYARAFGFQLLALPRAGRILLAASLMALLLTVARPSLLWSALALGVLGYAGALLLLGGLRIRGRELPALTV